MKTVLCRAFCVCAFFPVASAAPAYAQDGHEVPNIEGKWRSGDNDGVNCLYMLIRLSGAEVDYNTLASEYHAREGPPFARMERVARNYGLRLHLVKMTFDEAQKVAFPFISYSEYDASVGGHFDLILNMDDHAVLTVLGPTVTVNAIPAEPFRREWTGICIVARDDSRARLWRWVRRGGIILLLAYLARVAYTSRTRAPAGAATA